MKTFVIINVSAGAYVQDERGMRPVSTDRDSLTIEFDCDDDKEYCHRVKELLAKVKEACLDYQNQATIQA